MWSEVVDTSPVAGLGKELMGWVGFAWGTSAVCWRFLLPELQVTHLIFPMWFGKMPMAEAEEQEKDSMELLQERQRKMLRNCQRCLPLWVVLVFLGGTGAILWYFLGNNGSLRLSPCLCCLWMHEWWVQWKFLKKMCQGNGAGPAFGPLHNMASSLHFMQWSQLRFDVAEGRRDCVVTTACLQIKSSSSEEVLAGEPLPYWLFFKWRLIIEKRGCQFSYAD